VVQGTGASFLPTRLGGCEREEKKRQRRGKRKTRNFRMELMRRHLEDQRARGGRRKRGGEQERETSWLVDPIKGAA